MTEIRETQKSNSRGILIGIVVALLAVCGVEGFLLFKEKNTVSVQKDTIVAVNNRNDDLINRIDSVQKDLNVQLQRGDLLQSQKDSLVKLNDQLEADKKALKNQLAYVPAMRAKYEARLRDAEGKMSELQKKSDTSDSTISALFAESQGLKQKVQYLSDSISKIAAQKDELDKTVKIAQVLKADNFKVTVLKKSGKEKEDDEMTYRAKNIDKIKVSFNILENKVAVVETKEFFLRVLGPDGAVIYNESTGGGSIEVDGEVTYYTSKQEMLYDGKKQTMTFLYHNQGEWKKGKQRVEVLCEGKRIGEGTFTVK
ncbi:MAG TPA: hypothetical protein VL947_08465 [Cytophagales bacterium]|nr:hypothetical protein [Cytophagales bacterium]